MSSHFTALRCLFLIAAHHGIVLTPDKLILDDKPDLAPEMLKAMGRIGLSGKILRRRKWADLISLGSAYPALAELKGGYWVIVAHALQGSSGAMLAAVLDPRSEGAGVTLINQADFEANWTGRLLPCKRHYQVNDEAQPFGMRWFMPEILRNSRHFRDIGIAATMTNIISFGTPLFFNIIIDKVVPHQSYHTLYVVIVAFIMMLLVEAVFTYVRQRTMLFATNKIDARLASRTFDHLLKLPMQFFESSSSGILIRHMQQTESIRHFLTGRLFQVLLDASALPLLLVCLTLYSGKLTLLVLLFSCLIAGVIAAMVPTFRSQLERLYGAEGQRQADLVETIQGIRAVKSLALEAQRKVSWDTKVVNAVRRRNSVGVFGAIGTTITGVLDKMMQICILGIGAVYVFDGTLSIGALVAFNMLSGRVTGPLVQIVGLINEYQQVAISVKMLGTVMSHAPERDPNQRGICPPITGEMEFDDVTFYYEGSPTPALNHISFKITEGEVIGLVGRSGSGKTTITRMIQGIHTPQEGVIRLNGNDIRHVDLYHLRRSVGMVLQDNILFRGTIRDNIAAARPDASMTEVMDVARLAGADEFIDRLQRSYETQVEEGGTNFSGGQRQRLAIARALLTRPRLLIFDEATSALDPESEAIIQQNLSEIARGRTMLIVSHRLSSLVNADKILVLDRGAVVDYAPHNILLERCDIYSRLWNQQTRHVQ